MLKYKTKQKMLSKASAFLHIQNQYFSDKKTDDDMTRITTQPFWQSMRLSKMRLREKGLISETDIAKASKPMSFVSDSDNSRSEVGNFIQPIKEHKKIYADGHLIFSKKDDKFISVSAIKAKGDEENACCPNCGSYGKISSYIDGCDYCGSKFTVNDFEEKISSYALVENTPKKVLNTFKFLALIIGGLAVLFGIASVVSIILAIIANMSSSSSMETSSLIVFMIASELAPVFWNVFIYTGILFVIILILAFKLLGNRINKTQMVKSQIKGFIPEEFAQNLEFKLRNIHFASTAKEVNVYSTFDLDNVIADYKDVIECTLSKLTFTNVKKQENVYILDADAICALTKYHNNKVQIESEKISLSMSAPEDLQSQTLGSIHCYYCPNCSGTVNLLNGGVCDYCDTKMDYSKYSWMIEKYESKGKVANPFRKIKWLLLAVYAAIFIGFSAIALLANQNTIYYLIHFDECVDVSQSEYDTVKMMHEVVPGVLPLNGINDTTERTYTYYLDDKNLTPAQAINTYCAYLSDEGFSRKSATKNSYTYFRPVSYPKVRLDGHFEMEIGYDNEDDKIIVEYTIDDTPYEE